MKSAEQNAGKVLRVLIADDHYLVRAGLKQMLLSLKKELDPEVAEADSGEKALQYLEHAAADLLIVDYRMEGMNGVETIQRVLRFKPDIKILAFSNCDEYAVITAMMDAGALGYALKSISPQQLLTAIKTILQGKKYFCNEAAVVVITATEKTEKLKKLIPLSARELEVLRLIAAGLTNREIARELQLNKRTIDTHRQNLLKKMKAKNMVALVKLAAELELL